MSYDPAIPQPTHTPAQDVSQILTNFSQINTQFGIEHTALNSATNNGKHKYITLPSTPVTPAVLAGEWQLTHQNVGGTNFLQVKNNTPIDQYIPVRRQLSTVPVIVGTTNIINLAPLGNQHIGHIIVVDQNNRTRTILSPYSFVTPNVYLPGTAGQLISSTTAFTKLVNSGTFIALQSTIATNVDVILTYSFY